MDNKILLYLLTLFVAIIFLLIIFGSGNDEEESKGIDIQKFVDNKERIENNKQVVELVKKSDRLLGVQTNEANDNNYFSAFQISKSIGIDFTQLSLSWDDIETGEGIYQDPFGYLEAADSYYPTQDVKLVLVVSPIDTNNLRVPEYLREYNFDDDIMIESYNNMIDYVISQLPNTDLIAIAIGNEIDVYIEGNRDWNKYVKFYKETSKHIKNNHKEILVGSKTTFNAITDSEKKAISELNKYSDVIMVTYYPFGYEYNFKDPKLIIPDIDTLTRTTNKPIYILEAGYSSSTKLQSSEEKQAEFITEMFKAWDKHSEQIKLIDFVWLHDISKQNLDEFSKYYKTSDENFLEFLKTLGLKNNDGSSKLAFIRLKQETEKRDWLL